MNLSPKNYQAFSVTGDGGRLRQIFAPVSVSLSREIANIFHLPTPVIAVNSLWDTGASITSISKKLAGQLSLPAVGRQKIQCAGEPYESCIYQIDLILPNKVGFSNVKVTEFKDSDKFDVLVGMDIITSGDFAITNANNITVCSFRIPPNIEHIDYVKDHQNTASAQKAIQKFKRREKHRRH